MNKKIITFIEIIIFTVIFVFISGRTLYVLSDRSDTGIDQLDCFYAQPEDSIDVLFVGSSRVFCNVEPATLWKEYGYSSYDLATSSQRINNSLYLIEEALKTQKPEVIFLEISRGILPDTKDDDLQIMSMVSGMRYGRQMVSEVTSNSESKKWGDYLLKLPCYHTRYEELTRDDYLQMNFNQYKNTGKAGYKGKEQLFNVEGFEGFNGEPDYKTEFDGQESCLYVDKIKELCDSKGIKLILLNTPHISRSEYPWVDDYAKDNNLEYIDFSECYKDTELDTGIDFADGTHLNYLGAQKVSSYIGKYLYENYSLTDHRGDSYYSSWDENLSYFEQMYDEFILHNENGLGNYTDLIKDRDYTYCITLFGDYMKVDEGQMGALTKLGISEEQYLSGGCYILNGGNVLAYAGASDTLNAVAAIPGGIMEAGFDDNEPRVSVYNSDVMCHAGNEDIENGISIVVYSNTSEKLIDSVTFDADIDLGAFHKELQ